MQQESPTGAEKRRLKARAQKLKAVVRIGRHGLSEALLKGVEDALNHHGLIKVKFDDLKDRKKELAPRLAEKTGSEMIQRVGNVVVLYRRKPEPAKP